MRFAGWPAGIEVILDVVYTHTAEGNENHALLSAPLDSRPPFPRSGYTGDVPLCGGRAAAEGDGGQHGGEED